MTIAEIREFTIDLLDDVHELAQDPVADPEAIRAKVDASFTKLEIEIGEKK